MDFDDGKDEGAVRTIGEVSKALGIKPHVLRYWERQFEMLKPLKRSGSRRYYRPADIELIERIDDLVNRQGYTIKGARGALRSQQPGRPAGKPAAPQQGAATGPVDQPALPLSQAGLDRDELIVRLKGLRARLAAIVEA